MKTLKEFLRLYSDKQVMLIGLLGFYSGIPLLLVGSTLSLWLLQAKIDLTRIGLMSLTALPYIFKFVWAPLVDRLQLPFLTKLLGRRRSWLLSSQLLIVAMLTLISRLDPAQDMDILVLACLTLSFAAATQDIVMLTYQVERLGTSQYGQGEAMGIFGYRMGMLMAGAGAFHMASALSWNRVYAIMALISAIGLITTLFIAEPEFKKSAEAELREAKAQEYLNNHPKIADWQAPILGWLYGAVICPFMVFMHRKGWWLSLLILFLYKASDNLIGNMSNIFYAKLGFSLSEIANASKIFGMWASIAGGFVGGLMIARLGIIRSLFYGGLIHGLSLFAHLALYRAGYDPFMLYFTVGIEHFTGGMRLTALLTYQMILCTSSYAATQLALFTSLVTFGRTLFSSASGFLATKLGWPHFFAVAALLSTPGLILIWYLAKREGQTITFFKKQRVAPLR
jgi:PAT family beta-lactamase induction signal transducer AmpG